LAKVTKPRSKRNYINNKSLYEAMLSYHEKRKAGEDPRIPDYVGQSIMLICNKLGTKLNFSGYTYKDEMIGDGIENCVAAVNNFDPSKSNNPFAYFTQIAWNAFLRRIQKEKKQSYIKHKNFERSDIFNELADGLLDESDRSNVRSKSMEATHGVIERFEESMNRKKIKKVVNE